MAIFTATLLPRQDLVGNGHLEGGGREGDLLKIAHWETYDCPSGTITWSITSPILKLSNDNGRRSPGCYIKCLFKGKSPGNRNIEVKPPRSFIYFMSLLTIRGTPLTSSSPTPCLLTANGLPPSRPTDNPAVLHLFPLFWSSVIKAMDSF
ncbi:hypothetical protein CDAR_168391 [Caerostris darwini]|uniref:Uncharacterized protein n=1 Tax=Caerostris darwini TaxID=1538125 RepID=A0AAV4T883_9ARAC|nr:hypothetical protein CDAR_168391 [Caerostris darwini]